MPATGARWSIVLAAGDGKRLSELTTRADGVHVPKQFCSLRGGASLFGETLARAHAVAAPERTVAIVAEAHRPWWERERLGASRFVVQPENRGTAAGIVLPLLHVLDQDPDAFVSILPSDHFVGDTERFSGAVGAALDAAAREDAPVVLLGVTPDGHEHGYGWIVPESPAASGLTRVRSFSEKPGDAEAERLRSGGALWSSFVVVARARALLELFARRLPSTVARLEAARANPASLAAAYATLETRDASRDVFEASASTLRVLALPACGWTDLGTPERVRACLRVPFDADAVPPALPVDDLRLDLAAQRPLASSAPGRT